MLFSILRNAYYRLRYAYKMKDAERELNAWAIRLKTHRMLAFREMMAKFHWRSDGPVEWVPDSPEMVVARGWKDDCDGAAVLAEWGFRQTGQQCRIYRLKCDGSGHRVCVTNNNAWFTSNGSVVAIPLGAEWKEYILNWGWHRNRYKSIEVV